MVSGMKNAGLMRSRRVCLESGRARAAKTSRECTMPKTWSMVSSYTRTRLWPLWTICSATWVNDDLLSTATMSNRGTIISRADVTSKRRIDRNIPLSRWSRLSNSASVSNGWSRSKGSSEEPLPSGPAPFPLAPVAARCPFQLSNRDKGIQRRSTLPGNLEAVNAAARSTIIRPARTHKAKTETSHQSLAPTLWAKASPDSAAAIMQACLKGRRSGAAF